MSKHIVMEFERGGAVTATLLTDEAPKTCRTVLDALPHENLMIHAMWAGEELFFDGFPVKEYLDFENETNEITTPVLALVANPASKKFRHSKEGAFCVFYGRSRPRKNVDETVDVNVFATFADTAELLTVSRRIRMEGAEKVVIRAVD